MTDYVRECADDGIDALSVECRQRLAPWLFRSKYFNRSYHKPHGYAGDYQIVEWMYDLENCQCDDPTQPGIVNCLDYIFATVHSVQSVQERRLYFADMLTREYHKRKGCLRILDVASGGSRYTRDFLATVPDSTRISITLFDQDPAAIAFCTGVAFKPWEGRLTLATCCSPVTRIQEALSSGPFDVVVSSGLFDYLDDGVARGILRHMVRLTGPDGIAVVANFHPDDPSRTVKDWLVDWRLIFRDEKDLAALFPDPAGVTTSLSPNKALVYAFVARDGERIAG
jgi:SAM-dependent methyltransferase